MPQNCTKAHRKSNNFRFHWTWDRSNSCVMALKSQTNREYRWCHIHLSHDRNPCCRRLTAGLCFFFCFHVSNEKNCFILLPSARPFQGHPSFGSQASFSLGSDTLGRKTLCLPLPLVSWTDVTRAILVQWRVAKQLSTHYAETEWYKSIYVHICTQLYTP